MFAAALTLAAMIALACMILAALDPGNPLPRATPPPLRDTVSPTFHPSLSPTDAVRHRWAGEPSWWAV